MKISYRQRIPVTLLKDIDGYFLVVFGIKGNELPVHKLGDFFIERRKKNIAYPDIVNQKTLRIGDINQRKRFAVLTIFAYVVKHLAYRPVFFDRNKIRSHQTPDAILGVFKKYLGYFSLFIAKDRKELLKFFLRKPFK